MLYSLTDVQYPCYKTSMAYLHPPDVNIVLICIMLQLFQPLMQWKCHFLSHGIGYQCDVITDFIFLQVLVREMNKYIVPVVALYGTTHLNRLMNSYRFCAQGFIQWECFLYFSLPFFPFFLPSPSLPFLFPSQEKWFGSLSETVKPFHSGHLWATNCHQRSVLILEVWNGEVLE